MLPELFYLWSVSDVEFENILKEVPVISTFYIDINCFYCFSLSVQHITATSTTCIWQNIDTLESVAGLEAEKLVEAHGSFRLGHCLDCHAEYTQDWMKGESISVTVWIVMRSTLKTG